MSRIYLYLANEHGATALEYALVASLISIMIMATATQIGNNLISLFYNNLVNAF